MDPPALTARTSGSKRHTKNVSYSRTNVARRSTKGPLDAVDPLALDPLQQTTTDPLTAAAANIPIPSTPLSPEKAHSTHNPPLPPSSPRFGSKDLSFLLHPTIYHTLPPPLHHEYQPSTTQNIEHTNLSSTLKKHNFRVAAEYCAHRLSHQPPPPQKEAFSLFYMRLACLILLNYTALAAQESKVLEDISSPFYRSDNRSIANNATPVDEDGGAGGNILPWELQVLWARLTGIAHGDVRRSIGAYYDLAGRARRAYKACDRTSVDRDVWRERLQELSLGVASILVEAGDLESAARHLEGLAEERRPETAKSESRRNSFKDGDHDDVDENGHRRDWETLLASRRALVYLAQGDIDAAARCIHNAPSSSSASIDFHKPLLTALTAVAEGQYAEAADQLRSLLTTRKDEDKGTSGAKQHHDAIIQQNLAICLFYTGHVEDTVRLLGGLVDGDDHEDTDDAGGREGEAEAEDKGKGGEEGGRGRSFNTLLFNLATCFELTSEKAGVRKVELADRVMGRLRREENWAERSAGSDFKL